MGFKISEFVNELNEILKEDPEAMLGLEHDHGCDDCDISLLIYKKTPEDLEMEIRKQARERAKVGEESSKKYRYEQYLTLKKEFEGVN